MVKKKHNYKLEEVINKTLSNYEALYNTSDWAQMERILDAAPKSNSIKYKLKLLSIGESIKEYSKAKSVKKLFSPYFLIGLLVIAVFYFLYKTSLSYKILENTTNSTPQNTIPAVVRLDSLKTIAPANSKDVLKTEEEEQNNDTSAISENEDNTLQSDEIDSVKKENNDNEETISLEKTENQKRVNKKDSKKEVQILTKKNPTILIESHDSLLGLSVLPTENTPKQKETKKTSGNSFGRNNFLLQSINADSIKKHQNPPPQDTLK